MLNYDHLWFSRLPIVYSGFNILKYSGGTECGVNEEAKGGGGVFGSPSPSKTLVFSLYLLWLQLLTQVQI